MTAIEILDFCEANTHLCNICRTCAVAAIGEAVEVASLRAIKAESELETLLAESRSHDRAIREELAAFLRDFLCDDQQHPATLDRARKLLGRISHPS